MLYHTKLKNNNINHDETTLVFIYGSLKKGFCNHHMLKKAKYKCKAKTRKRYGMFQERNANYPYLIKQSNSCYHHVEGEIYEVKTSTTLKQLDIFEDAPEYYQREIIEIETTSGSIQKAQVYFMKEYNIPSEQTPLREWKEGDNYHLKQFESYYSKATATAC